MMDAPFGKSLFPVVSPLMFALPDRVVPCGGRGSFSFQGSL